MYAIKRELKLNNKEQTLINKHLGFSRFCFNYGLSIYNQLDHNEFKGGSSNKIDLVKKVFTNVTKKKPEFSWTKDLSSRVYQNAFRNLKNSYTRYWKGLGGRPKFKRKKLAGSFTVDSSNGVILQEHGRRVKLPTLGTFRTFSAIPKCVAQTYTVSRSAGKYYVSFVINAELAPIIQHQIFKPIGVDVNLTNGKYCVLSDGTEITFPKPLKAAITKLKKFQYRNRNKQLGNRKTGEKASKNAKKYYRQLARLHQNIANQRNDFLQKLTTDLARKYAYLKLETLNIRGMLANKKLAFHIADASFYKFKMLLEHKARIYGGIVESLSMWYSSSKLCSQCQKKKADLRLSDRLYVCNSPFCIPIDRDLNSAINLENAPPNFIVNRVGSTRIQVCGHSSADTYESSETIRHRKAMADCLRQSKQKVNIKARQFVLPLSNENR